MPWRSLLVVSFVLVSVTAEASSFPSAFRIEVDGRLSLAERGGGILLGEQADHQLGLDSAPEIRVAVSGSALTGNCKTGQPLDIYNHEVTTVKIFKEDYSSKNFTLISSDFFLVYLEMCSKVLLLAGLRRSGFTLQFDRVKMTVTPLHPRPPIRRLHSPIFCPERYVDLHFSPKTASSSIVLALNPPNSEVKGESVSTGPIEMLSNVTSERGFPSGDELGTPSDTKHAGDLDSGSGNDTTTSPDTKHARDLDSGSGNGTTTSHDTKHARDLDSGSGNGTATSTDTKHAVTPSGPGQASASHDTLDPRRPRFPV
ncbi:uncharacterized protein LOC119594344 [Penaeus monodon]|uniref:uncharacterized protein LOC119594344 n=1 Tax=Penaeus monodon TaxID=6687 RepID=UPI0018A6EE09|nr:uncharacterized protein LOC119594344 [Penaeus monodon]